MFPPHSIASPYDSCHHKDTSLGDTFGSIGTDKEYRLEEAWNRGRRQFIDLARSADSAPPAVIPDLGTQLTDRSPHTRDTLRALADWRTSYLHETLRALADWRVGYELTAHESTHD